MYVVFQPSFRTVAIDLILLISASQGQNIILAVGNGDRLVHQNRELSGKLWAKGIGNALREWDGFSHDWPVWHKMVNLYIGGEG